LPVFAKIHSISALVNEINQYQILPPALASLYGHVLPYAEIIIGILLVLGIVLRITTGNREPDADKFHRGENRRGGDASKHPDMQLFRSGPAVVKQPEPGD